MTSASFSSVDDFRAFDLFEFARSAREAVGQVRLDELPRMVNEVPADAPDSPVLHWRIRGAVAQVAAADGAPGVELRLEADVEGAVWLCCQRCLAVYRQPLDVKARYRIVETDAEADQAPLDDDAFDTIVGSRRFDLLDLLDEELLLSLPLVPKHPVCPSVHEALRGDGAEAAADGDSTVERADEADEVHEVHDRPNPFAVLGAWKRGPSGSNGSNGGASD